MKKATRKIYLSLIFVALSLLTMVATTFAWVGILSNASFERISINLETDSENSDYGVLLSLTGKSNDFHESIDTVDLQRTLLTNMGVPNVNRMNDNNVRVMFNQIKLAQCTTTREYNSLGRFTSYDSNSTPKANIGGKTTNYAGYLEFDLWVTLFKVGDEEQGQGSNNKLSIYLRSGESGELMTSNNSSAYIANEIKMPGLSNPMSTQILDSSSFGPGKSVVGNVNMNPANATRLAVQKAEAIDYEAEPSNSNFTGYNGIKIYRTGSAHPTYDERNQLYDFGGVLPTDFNFARLVYNSVRPENEHLPAVPNNVLESVRGDEKYVDDGIKNNIVDESDNVTISKKIRLHFTFWFEGWDADCFEAINDQTVYVNLSFTTKNPNEIGG